MQAAVDLTQPGSSVFVALTQEMHSVIGCGSGRGLGGGWNGLAGKCKPRTVPNVLKLGSPAPLKGCSTVNLSSEEAQLGLAGHAICLNFQVPGSMRDLSQKLV